MAVALPEFIAGLFVGLVLGVGGAIFFIRWRMRKQLGSLEDQMGAIMDMSEEMSGMMDPEEMDLGLDEENGSEEGKKED